MNTNFDNLPLNDTRFDRLVDDELNEEERRQLLARLDAEPNGWRRCALAFLESQCWKQTLGAIAQPSATDKSPEKAIPLRRSRWHDRALTLAAMAACFFIVFWVGSQVLQTRTDRAVAPTGTSGDVASTAGALPQGNSPSAPWRMVTVSAPAGESIRVPAVERDNIDPRWVQNLPPPVPDDVMRAFSRTGHQIEQHRELVPVPLKDGRRLVVPVDQVDVHYVGNGTY